MTTMDIFFRISVLIKDELCEIATTHQAKGDMQMELINYLSEQVWVVEEEQASERIALERMRLEVRKMVMVRKTSIIPLN